MFIQAAGLTGLGDLGGLAGVGNRRGACQNRTGSSFIDITSNRFQNGKQVTQNPETARTGS